MEKYTKVPSRRAVIKSKNKPVKFSEYFWPTFFDIELFINKWYYIIDYTKYDSVFYPIR